MKKLSKMLICFMLCFMVTCLATNAAYTNRSANSTKLTLNDSYVYFKINATIVVTNGKKSLMHRETFEKHTGNIGVAESVKFNTPKPTCITYSDHYELTSYATITLYSGRAFRSSGTLLAKIY